MKQINCQGLSSKELTECLNAFQFFSHFWEQANEVQRTAIQEWMLQR